MTAYEFLMRAMSGNPLTTPDMDRRTVEIALIRHTIEVKQALDDTGTTGIDDLDYQTFRGHYAEEDADWGWTRWEDELPPRRPGTLMWVDYLRDVAVPYRVLHDDIEQAIAERLRTSFTQDPTRDPEKPWQSTPDFGGQVSIYELVQAILPAVLPHLRDVTEGGGSVAAASCRATLDDPSVGHLTCVREAGHYDPDAKPNEADPNQGSHEWHVSRPTANGSPVVWGDKAKHATPHIDDPAGKS